jgi:hypothetical protein
MSESGRQLEAFVALIEKLHLPESFKITSNERVYEGGVQVAEFDVIVEGKVGTTDIKWLIECRDRPSEGAAPTGWIEQLIGRKQRFNFNKVTAVSTTGFAGGVPPLAAQGGIELREVRSLAPEQVKSWFLVESMPIIERASVLVHARLGAAEDEPEDRRKLFDKIVTTQSNELILWHTEIQKHYTIRQAFHAALLEKQELFDGLEPDGPPRSVELQVNYPDRASRFVVRTDLGDMHVLRIDFQCELRLTSENVPVTHLSEYSHSSSGESIAQLASFKFSALGHDLSLEFHKRADTGETHVMLRKVDKTR